MPGGDKNWNAKVVLFGIEGTEGTDAGPTVLANAYRVLNYQPQFMDATGKTRALEKAFFGADPQAMSGFRRGATFDMEMHGGGASAGTTIPPWMTLLRICGFGAPVVGASSVTQAPITAGIPSATHYGYIDDLLLISTGGRASVSFKIEDQEYPSFSLSYLGIPPQSLASQVVPGSPTIVGYIDPVLCNTANTDFLLDGYALGLRRLTVNMAATNDLRTLIGPPDKIKQSGRAPTFEIVAQVPDLTTKNYFDKVRPGATMPMQVIQGITSGNIVQVDAPKLQITSISLSNEDGTVMMTMGGTVLPNAGNDEVLFTTK